MVLTTTPTQWTLPFINSISTGGGGGGAPTSAHANVSSSSSSSSILCVSSTQQNSTVSATALSPATLCKPGSVLGLKSCSLSKPPSSSSSSSSSIAHLDLHTHSLSRRFIEAIVSDSPLHYPTYNTRSAGSFRLIDESFSWVINNKDNEEKPICALPLFTSMNAPVVPIRAGRWSFEEKPMYELPWCTPLDTHVAPAGAGNFSIEEKPIDVMHSSTSLDASAVPTRASKPKNSHTLTSDMACSTSSIDTPAAPTRADQWSIEGKPISANPFSARIGTPGAPNTKLNNEGEPISAIPFSSACEASIAPIIRAGRFNVELDGDITAADVDLLPMPGLVSLASPLYDSYLSVSPTDSRMTRISSSDYLSTANSTSNSASKVAPNYLGLPPEFLQEVDGKLTCCKVPVVASKEEEDLGCPSMQRGGSNACLEGLPAAFDDFAASNSSITNPYPVVEDDNFAESQSLAGLWSTHDAIHCDNVDSVLQGSEGLASILTDLPHTHHASVAAQSGPCNTLVDVESCIGSDFIMDELEYLMMPGRLEAISGVGALEATPTTAQQGVDPAASSEATVKGGQFAAAQCKAEMEMHSGRLHNATIFTPPYTHFEGKEGSSSLTGACPCESLQGSSVVAPRMALLPGARPNVPSQYVGSGNQSLCVASFPMSLDRKYMPNGPPCMMIGKKRPFSVFDHLPRGLIPPSPGIFNPNFSHIMARQSDSMQQENLESKASEMSYTSATQAFSAMLYKAQGGGAAHVRPSWAASQVNDSGDGIKTPPSKARRRHGTAMDPQSIAARTRREKFSDRIRILQSLVPNGERLDTVSMLGQTLEYVRFLQHQVWQLYHGMDPASNIKCEKWKDFLEPAHEPAST